MTCLERSGYSGMLLFPTGPPPPGGHNSDNFENSKVSLPISLCSKVLNMNKSLLILPEFSAIGRIWIVLQNSPAGALANFIGIWGVIKTKAVEK